ncbi:Outer membrane protein assembly factor BamD [bacterium HR21]|nr:Outer membrane protein assembly factor BamD [bacterium HR21]
MRQSFSLIVLLLGACASIPEPDPRDVEALFRAAQLAYEKKEDMLAQKWLELIRTQYPASQYADDALFLLAELRFRRGEYIMAAFLYQQFRQTYPNSPYARQALYQIGQAYRALSPPYDRDQEYTYKALAALNEFRQLYPGDSLLPEVEQQIRQLRNKLAQREYSIAQLYTKLHSPQSALIYYDGILQQYADTDFVELAWVGKIRALVELGRWAEAQQAIETYRRLFPNGAQRQLVETVAADLNHGK